MEGHNRFSIDPEVWAKFDSGLRRAIANTHISPTVELTVMIVLVGPTEISAAVTEGVPGQQERARLVAERQAAFEHEVADLVRELEQFGARDVRLFWINHTLSARLGLQALQAVGRRDEVKKIVLVVRQKVIAMPALGREV